jgi:hypothetical protein
MKKINTSTSENHKDKNLLYKLEGLIKSLYPGYNTVNPYDEYLQEYYNDLVIEDVLLFKRLLKSITIINHKERPQEHRKYISSYGDVLTTIELLSNYTINDHLMNYYAQLKDIFQDRPFTKLQASRVIRKSVRSVERSLELWRHLKLAEKTKIKQGSKAMYQLLGYESTHEKPVNIYDEMMEEYNDYKGFINLQERT